MKKKITNNVLVTKNMLQEAVDAILSGVNLLISNSNNELKEEIKKLSEENAMEHLEQNRKINDLKADTPTITQYRQLDEKLDHHILHHHLAS